MCVCVSVSVCAHVCVVLLTLYMYKNVCPLLLLNVIIVAVSDRGAVQAAVRGGQSSADAGGCIPTGHHLRLPPAQQPPCPRHPQRQDGRLPVQQRHESCTGTPTRKWWREKRLNAIVLCSIFPSEHSGGHLVT